jgi:hypothetical protein
MKKENEKKLCFKVIEDYPGNNYLVGEIIYLFQGVDDDSSIFKPIKYFEKYPNIFKLLKL